MGAVAAVSSSAALAILDNMALFMSQLPSEHITNMREPACNALAFLLLTIALASCGMRSAANSTADWPLYNGDYQSTRFSKLSEISPANVSNLRQVCAYKLPESVTFESGLVAVQRTLYFTTYESTYAIDAGTCALKWRASHPIGTIPAAAATRGVAYWNGHVYRGRLRCSHRAAILDHQADGQQRRVHLRRADRMEWNALHWHSRRR
jgi:glucose dehydrogenase